MSHIARKHKRIRKRAEEDFRLKGTEEVIDGEIVTDLNFKELYYNVKHRIIKTREVWEPTEKEFEALKRNGAQEEEFRKFCRSSYFEQRDELMHKGFYHEGTATHIEQIAIRNRAIAEIHRILGGTRNLHAIHDVLVKCMRFQSDAMAKAYIKYIGEKLI